MKDWIEELRQRCLDYNRGDCERIGVDFMVNAKTILDLIAEIASQKRDFKMLVDEKQQILKEHKDQIAQLEGENKQFEIDKAIVLGGNEEKRNQIKQLQTELTELKAMHVTHVAVAMADVCEAARAVDLELIDRCIDTTLGEWGDDEELNKLTLQIQALQQALRRLAEVKGEKR